MKYFLILIIIFFSSCSNQRGDIFFNKSSLYEKGLINTKILKINKNNSTKLLVTYTYLNDVYEIFNSDKFDYYLVGIKNLSNIKFEIQKENSILLNIIENYDQINKLKIEKLPFYSKWLKYQIYIFQKSSNKNLKLFEIK